MLNKDPLKRPLVEDLIENFDWFMNVKVLMMGFEELPPIYG